MWLNAYLNSPSAYKYKWGHRYSMYTRRSRFLAFPLHLNLRMTVMGYMKEQVSGCHIFDGAPRSHALIARVALKSKLHKPHMKGKLTSCCEAVKYLRQTGPTDEITADTDAHMLWFVQLLKSHPGNTLKRFGASCFGAAEYMTKIYSWNI